MSGEKINVWPLGRGFTERWHSEQEIVRQKREAGGELPRLCKGSYRMGFMGGRDFDRTQEKFGALDLVGGEVVLYEILRQKLSERKGEEPVVAIDIGGMLGATWCRLAKHFEKDILEGRLQMVVSSVAVDSTNLGEVMKMLAERGEMTPELVEVLEEGQGLVEYVKATVGELWEMYRGRASLVFEARSICHSLVPDLVWPLAAMCLESDGLLIGWDVSTCPGAGHEEARRRAFDLGINTLNTAWWNMEMSEVGNIWSPSPEGIRFLREADEYKRVVVYRGKGDV